MSTIEQKIIITHDPKNTKVALLRGGWNSEQEISLQSGQGILKSLKRLGYITTYLDLRRDLNELLEFLNPKPDIIFNALHGHYLEDGRIQGIFDILDIPYTHSPFLASAIAMHKPTAKKLFQSVGIPCAQGGVFDWDLIQHEHPMDPPYVVKPLEDGSSVGVHIIKEGMSPLNNSVPWTFGKQALIEEFVEGQELSCAVMGGKALGVIELRTKLEFYDYKAKYMDGLTTHIMPAAIPESIYEKIMHYSEQAHSVLGCKGLTRCDFRYDPVKDYLVILEINTQPGFTPLSLVPEIGAYKGYTFDDLVKWQIEDGLCRA